MVRGAFVVSITKNKNFKLGWKVHLLFAISLHKRDKALLEQIQNYFKVGSINWTHEPESIQYRVQSIKDLRVVIDHFDKYPLITDKWADYGARPTSVSTRRRGGAVPPFVYNKGGDIRRGPPLWGPFRRDSRRFPAQSGHRGGSPPFQLMLLKEHLTENGLRKIIAIIASMNHSFSC